MPLATLRYQLSLSLSAARVASYPLCVCKTTNLFLLFAVLKMFKGCLPAILLSLLVAMASPQADGKYVCTGVELYASSPAWIGTFIKLSTFMYIAMCAQFNDS